MNGAITDLQLACDTIRLAQEKLLKPKRVLFVDDDKGIQTAFKMLTKNHNCEVDYAADGMTGERMALSGGYDLCVLDVNLPHKSGIEIFRSMRVNHVATPVAIFTGIFDDRLAQECNAIGYADHVRKPDDFMNQRFFDEMLASKHILKRGADINTVIL
jgi:DNA-binding NtrC family response regulator